MEAILSESPLYEYVYQKDERALPRKLQSSKFTVPHCRNRYIFKDATLTSYWLLKTQRYKRSKINFRGLIVFVMLPLLGMGGGGHTIRYTQCVIQFQNSAFIIFNILFHFCSKRVRLLNAAAVSPDAIGRDDWAVAAEFTVNSNK
jgi:hypothetical protein